jgi:hypothetical protein
LLIWNGDGLRILVGDAGEDVLETLLKREGLQEVAWHAKFHSKGGTGFPACASAG